MADIEHVVVLMFENRSFDHLFGLLYEDDPQAADFPGVGIDDPAFSNPLDPMDPNSAQVFVSGDGSPDLAVDPPHSHGSVVEQMGIRAIGEPKMNGFVAAYSRKIDGNEDGRPVIHWGRIIGTLVGLVTAVAAVLALPAWLPLVLGGLALIAVVGAAVLWAYRAGRALPVALWWPLFAGPPAVLAALGSVSALVGLAAGYVVRFGVLAALIAVGTGLVVRLRRKRVNTPPPIEVDQAQRIMRCMRPDKLPALATLAKNFALCTRWHCSVPGATWPNRNFAHAGTSDGTVDIEIGFYDNDTIFNRLHEAKRSWRIYRHPRSLAQVMAFDWLLEDDQIHNWRSLDDFAKDVASAEGLAAYSFIEPCHDGDDSNSQHPGNNDNRHAPADRGLWDFQRGEQLIISIYEALRANPDVFAKTLFVITYDEHGGFYDHVPPPTDAIEPEPFGSERRSVLPLVLGWFVEQPQSRFRFRVLGPRVPAVVISPRIPQQWEDTLYDHTAIPRTVRKLFAPRTPKLSEREDQSPTLDQLVTLDEPRIDLPDLSGQQQPVISTATAAGVPTPMRDDDFALQLRTLAPEIHSKLVSQHGSEARQMAEATQSSCEPPSEEDTAALFTHTCQRGRDQ